MKRILIISFSLLQLAGSAIPLSAAEHKRSLQFQETPLILKAVENFIYNKTTDLSGQIIVNLSKIDSRITLPQCPEMEPFIPTGGRLWGKTSIGVRCNSQTPWTIYVQADIKIMADVLHAAQPITQGRPISSHDIVLQKVNLVQMPEGVLTDVMQAIGQIPRTNLTSGQPLRQHMLRAPYVILRGQKVKLHIQGQGFNISSEGQALADAAEGKIVQVRNESGRVISGIAHGNSIVQVQP